MSVVSFRWRMDERGQIEVSAVRTTEIALLTVVEIQASERFPPAPGWYGSIVFKSGHAHTVWAPAEEWKGLASAMATDYLENR